MSAVKQAIEFAREIHKNQWRKSSPLPYIVHPLRVYYRAKKINLPERSQVLSILHDTYEDSINKKQTLESIKKMFGDTIANLVVLLSHDSSTDYVIYFLKLSLKSKTALEVKILDMVDNISDNPYQKQIEKYKDAIESLLNTGYKPNKNMEKYIKYILLK